MRGKRKEDKKEDKEQGNTRVHLNSPAYRCLVFFVDFDGFVRLARDQSAAALVKRHGEDSRLTVQRPRLHCGLQALEVVPSLPVPEVHAAVIGCDEDWKERKGLEEATTMKPCTVS